MFLILAHIPPYLLPLILVFTIINHVHYAKIAGYHFIAQQISVAALKQW